MGDMAKSPFFQLFSFFNLNLSISNTVHVESSIIMLWLMCTVISASVPSIAIVMHKVWHMLKVWSIGIGLMRFGSLTHRPSHFLCLSSGYLEKSLFCHVVHRRPRSDGPKHATPGAPTMV